MRLKAVFKSVNREARSDLESFYSYFIREKKNCFGALQGPIFLRLLHKKKGEKVLRFLFIKTL